MKQHDMKVADAGKMRVELQDKMSAMIQKFTDETGLIVEDIDVGIYSKRQKDGFVTTTQVPVTLIIRI